MSFIHEDLQIVTTRIIHAPQKIVFRAWTEPEHLIKWWGPKGFTNTFNEFDLKPAGYWRFIMHGPEGGNYDNECRFISIEPDKFISWDHLSDPKFKIEVNFNALDELRTMLVWKMIFDTVEECNKIKKFAPAKNEENIERLEKEIEEMNSHK